MTDAATTPGVPSPDTTSPDTTSPDAIARRVLGGMLAADTFTRWLGAEVVDAGPRRCVLRMPVRADMLNGLGTCHGGVTFALADSAFAIACNSHGTVCVALDCTISYPNAARTGDVLTASAEAELEPRRVGFYRVTVTNAAGDVVALFRGTAYDTRRAHPALDAAPI